MRVRCRIQPDSATKNSHHSTVPQTVTGPTWKFDEKMFAMKLNPSIWLMSELDTEPVTSFVTPRLAPCRTKNVPSVIRKLGMPVFITRYPLMKPTSRQNSSETSAPTTRLMPKYQQSIELTRPALIVMTPADRSNSPPIMSMPTPTATMPIVEDWYSTVKKDSAERNADAIIRKKMKMMTAATSAPTSGRPSTRLAKLSRTRLDGSEGAAV